MCSSFVQRFWPSCRRVEFSCPRSPSCTPAPSGRMFLYAKILFALHTSHSPNHFNLEMKWWQFSLIELNHCNSMSSHIWSWRNWLHSYYLLLSAGDLLIMLKIGAVFLFQFTCRFLIVDRCHALGELRVCFKIIMSLWLVCGNLKNILMYDVIYSTYEQLHSN